MRKTTKKTAENLTDHPLSISSAPEAVLREALRNMSGTNNDWTEKDFSTLLNEVIKTYDAYGDLKHIEGKDLPSPRAIVEILENLMTILFPNFFGDVTLTKTNIQYFLGNMLHSLHSRLTLEIEKSLKYACRKMRECQTDICQTRAHTVSKQLLEAVPRIRTLLAGDMRAAYSGDPAAKSLEEIVLSYPCAYAIATYRIAHELHKNGVPIIPRIMSEHAHSKTGIDIHPGATIGRNFFIDHGTGVVIGETSEIGDNVRIYQGVTLGGLSLPTYEVSRFRNKKRHPTIKDNVIIYSGATILGGKTTIGQGAVIGGNVWITKSIPSNTTVTTTPGELSYKPNGRMRKSDSCKHGEC